MTEEYGVEPIAIVGLACRVPGARDARQFWDNLAGGVESIRWFTREEQLKLGMPEEAVDNPDFISAAVWLDDVEYFDAGLFGMTDREADVADPQHRLFLELAQVALDDAGYDTARYKGSIGVYAGTGTDDYMWRHVNSHPSLEANVGRTFIHNVNSPDYVATLASYKLNLHGPSLTLHTACSTSLVAVHLACEALRNGECDMALAGGVCIELPMGRGYIAYEGGISSQDGHCRPFDSRASGTIWSSGGGAVLLKRLSEAIADGDAVRAIVLGNAINNDGSAKVGFTAPSVGGQTEVISQALAVAGVDPRSVSYVEAHGTGTRVGDPIEVAGLTRAYRSAAGETHPGQPERGWCRLGSVKSNLGHMSQASGVIGVIKTVLALEHELIPPSLHYEEPNPAIDFAASPFTVNAVLSTWKRSGQPRRAGVSSFGIGGTNAHVILQEGPLPENRDLVATPPARPELLRLSARSETALANAAQRLSAHLAAHPQLSLADVAYTLHAGRGVYAHRATVVATDTADAVKALADRKRLHRGSVAGAAPTVAFLFSGQGAQYAGMASGLYEAEPVFRAAVDECADILGANPLAGDDEWLGQTEHTQPALFTVEYALAQLWQSWGIRPAAMIGHSIGEYVAAMLTGVFTLPDALRLVATRGRLMQSMPPGSMLAVQADMSTLDVPDGLSVSVVNGPGTCVVGGPTPLVEVYARRLGEQEIGSRILRTSHAFHSPMMEPILASFVEAVAAVPRQAPALPFLSNRTGDWITPAQAVDPQYWAEHLRETVRFGACVARLLSQGDWQLVECGPGAQLAGLARMQSPARAPLASLPGPKDKADDLTTAYTTAGKLWACGVPVEFGRVGRRVSLPAYPFERGHHWIDVAPESPAATAPARDKGLLDMADWCSVPVWRQLAPATASAVDGPILLIGQGRTAEEIGSRLGPDVTAVGTGDREYYAATLAGFTGRRIVYAAGLSGAGFFDLLSLAQALAGQEFAEPVHLDVLTAGAQAVLGGDAADPEQATAAGVALALPLEATQVSVRLIDLPSSDAAAAAATEILAGPTGEHGELVALRSGRRWTPEYAPVPLPEQKSDAIRDEGVYLITGGLGGIGITVAEDLGVRHRAKLVLLSRSGLPGASHVRRSRAEAAIARIEAAGGEVLALAGDVTDPGALREVRARILERFGRLDGIVHAAGNPGGGLIEVKTREAADDVLAPKIAGTRALAAAFGDLDLDFVLLCGSVTGIIGGLGQVDYTAANAFLDAYAHNGTGFAGRVLSIDWGGWLEVGMAAEVDRPDILRQPVDAPAGTPVAHPILTRKHPGHLSGVVGTATHWTLAEHHVAGVPVMPGTGHLEIARAAIETALAKPAAQAVVELRDVTFLTPLSVPPGTSTEVRVLLEPAGDGLDFQIVTGGVTHVRGSGGWVRTPVPTVDFAALRARCTPMTAIKRTINAPGSLVTLGPRWQPPESAYEGATEALARMVTPPEAAGDADRWVLHPATLDVATAFSAPGGEGPFLPLGYGRVTVFAPMPPTFWAYARRKNPGSADVVALDLQLFDDTGRLVVDIAEFVLRKVDPRAAAGTVATPAPQRATQSAGGFGIRPEQGAEVLRRLVGADLGPQVVVNIRTVAEVAARNRATTTGTVAEGAPGALLQKGAAIDRDRDYEAPRTDLEVTLAAVWGDILGVADVARDDDFFDLGGNSLVAVQLVAQVRKVTQVRLPIRGLFEAPSVAGMAEQIEKLQAEAPATAEPTIPRLARPQ